MSDHYSFPYRGFTIIRGPLTGQCSVVNSEGVKVGPVFPNSTVASQAIDDYHSNSGQRLAPRAPAISENESDAP